MAIISGSLLIFFQSCVKTTTTPFTFVAVLLHLILLHESYNNAIGTPKKIHNHRNTRGRKESVN